MFLPMENQEPGERLRRDFRSPAQRALRCAVGHEHYLWGVKNGVWGFPRQDLSQVNGSLLSFPTLLIRADDSRFGLRSCAGEALTQCQRLQDGDPLIRFQGESSGPSNLANYVNDAGAGNLDDVAGMNQRIAARIIGLEKILQVHLHDIFGCGSIAVEARLHLLHPDVVLCRGPRLIRCTETIYGPFWFCGQSCASQNDDAFSRIVGQAFRKRENLKQRLASTDLENAWPSHRPHHRNGMALHLAYKHADVRVLHVSAVKEFLEDEFQLPRGQFRRSNRPD